MARPVVHLVCNAHLDPVWMWTWQEGLREALSTFRTAADLLDEFPEFVFNHNESLLYEWVEEHDPALFARVEALVQTGRWNITGGWYLQPDLNMPGGETVARLITEGRRYFAEKFGVCPSVAYNFDTFGHPTSLPQMLKQAGFGLYIHCRPVAQQLDLPAPLYRWRGCDGSEVLALRPDTGWYCTPRPGQAQEQARTGIAIARQTGRDTLVLWGLGDHGGGATRQDLQAFRALIAELAAADVEVRHSTPEAYLTRIQAQLAAAGEPPPVFAGELQRTLAGTYTSVAPIKQALRQSEALLASAERWAAIAWWRLGQAYPAEELRAAWKSVMFNTFHDTLCGSLLEAAIPGVLDIFGSANHTAQRIILRAQHALLPNVPPAPETLPIYVFNPHSVPLRAPVGLNILSHYAPPPERRPITLVDDAGAPVPHQEAGGPAVLQPGTWQPYVGFVAEVPPLAVRRYEVRFEPSTPVPAGKLSWEESAEGLTLTNRWWAARFDRHSAALVSLLHRPSGRELLAGPVQLWAMQDVSHAWGGENRVIFNEPLSPFSALSPEAVGAFAGVEGQAGPALRVINAGPVSVTAEMLVGWQHSRAALQITCYADHSDLDISLRLYMAARRKMIKLVLPFDLPAVRAITEIGYGSTARPADNTEYPCGRWLRLETDGFAVGIANHGQAGFDAAPEGTLRLSLTRGATHCSWEGDPGGPPVDPAQSYSYMDQQQLDYRFRLLAGPDAGAVAAHLIPAALELNQPLECFYTFHPPTIPATNPAQAAPFLQIEPPTVMLGALKRDESGTGLIVRLAETVGQPTVARVALEGGPAQMISFDPHQLRTFRLVREGDAVQWRPTSLLEE